MDCAGGTADGSDESWNGVGCDGGDSDLCVEGSWECTSGSQTCSDVTGDDVEVCDDVIQCHDELISGNVTLDLNKTVTVEGGYDCSYTDNTSGITSINGNMTISDGVLTIDTGTLELQYV